MSNKFLIVDGSSLIHRAFFALPILTNNQGQYTNAVYGFCTMLNKILQTEQPAKVAVCFDKSRVTFRTAIFGDYKGHRSATPDELKPQFEYAKNLLEAMDIAWEEIEGFEADDIIGTLARLGSGQGEVLILTGDRDALQLINNNTKVMLTKKGITNTEVWDESTLLEHYNLTPKAMIDLKALMGDASDNIPGITGVGEKTALKLLAEYDNLDNVLANAQNISAKGLREKVTNGKEQAEMSKKLAIIDCYMPGFEDLSKYDYQAKELMESPKLVEFYKTMNFTSLLRNTIKNPIVSGGQAGKALEAQTLTSLFAEAEIPAYTQLFANQAEELLGQTKIALDLYKDSLAIATAEGKVYLAKWQDLDPDDSLAALFADPKVEKYTCQGKDLLVKLAKLGIKLQGIKEDIALGAYLLDPVANKYLPWVLGEKYLGKARIDEKAYTQEEIGALAASFILPLWAEIEAKLKAENLYKLYQDLEMPLAKVLAEIELAGIVVSKQVLEKMNLELSAMEATLTTEIYDLAGRSFNINSPKQLGEVLFNELGLPPIKKTKTGYSTDVEVLEQLSEDHAIAKKVLTFRSYSKLRSTYAQGLQALIEDDGKIHTSFNQTVTATGRLSSTEPNLQNIPVREELGRRLRGAFFASPGNTLLAADYSQIELRVLAHISDDKVLQNSFIHNEDIHARTAAEVFDVDISQVTREQRRMAKAVNFGIVYGISDYGLARDLGISRAEGKEYIDKYLANYDGVRFYMKDIVEQGKAKGYVETLLGRKRWLPDLKNKNYNLRSFAERTALNTPIQGTAADIIKLAMLKIAEVLKAQKLQTTMVLQVHDELIFDVPRAELDQVKAIIKAEMEGAYPLKVPTTVDMKTGDDWYNMQKID